jgi:hypothetical protein
LSGRRVSNPQPPAWKAGALPIELLPLFTKLSFEKLLRPSFALALKTMWGKMDSNHRSRKTADLQSAPFGHSGITPNKKRAEEGTRTPDQLITNQLLYQLSYSGFLIILIFKELFPHFKGLQN